MSARPRRKFQLGVETLEDRCLMATRVWDGGATSNNWSNPNNWMGNVAPQAGDDLVFPTGISDKTADNDYAHGTNFNSITFNGFGYNLRGNRIFLGTGGIIDNSGSSNQINNDLDLGSAAGSTPRIFQVNTGSTLFIDGEIRGGTDLHKTGGGDLSFRDNNVYSGLTDIKAGRLFIEKDESLGAFNVSSAGTIIRTGATLFVNDQGLGAVRTDEPITIHNGGTIRVLNDVELRGNMATVGTATLKHEGSFIERLLITGQISGAGGLFIATGSGQVWLQGAQSNTYQGLTNVVGKLRLDNSAGNAIPGDLVINGSGVVRYDRDNQIANQATVTVNGGAKLLTNERDDTFARLKLQGGSVDGNQLDLVDFLQRSAKLRVFIENTESTLFVDALEATSTTATQSATLLDLSVRLNSSTGTIVVTDGPAFNDFIVQGPIHGFPVEEDDVVLTLNGNGTTIIQDFAADRYAVNQGLLRMNRFERERFLFDFSFVDVTVNAGGSFAGDATIGNLHVLAGGRVRPGPLSSTGVLEISDDLTLDPGAILEVSLSGNGHDLIDVDGLINLTGAVLEATVGSGAQVGQQFTVVRNDFFDNTIGQFFTPAASSPFIATFNTNQRLGVNYVAGLGNNDVLLTLQNTPPMAPGIAIDQTDIVAGTIVSVTGHLVDPDGRSGLRLLVDWGDGSKKLVLKPGLEDFTLRHRYRRAGEFVARFKWIDQTGQGNSREFTVNVEPGIPLGGNQLRSLTDRVFALGLRR